MVEIAADLLLDARVRDIHGATSRKVATTGPGSTVPELLEKMRAHPRSRHIYVVDAQFENVQIFDENGRLLMAFGQEGSEPGSFSLPAGLAIDNQDRIWVAEPGNRRLQVFTYVRASS